MNEKSHMLRHYLASLAYHITKVIGNVPEIYPNFELGSGVRTPIQIINHISEVLLYAYKCYNPSDYLELNSVRITLITWNDNVDFLYKIFEKLDHIISYHQLQEISEEQLLQGPFSDAMTHIGQLSMLRRVSGFPVPPENFIFASIKIGVVGSDQPDAVRPVE